MNVATRRQIIVGQMASGGFAIAVLEDGVDRAPDEERSAGFTTAYDAAHWICDLLERWEGERAAPVKRPRAGENGAAPATKTLAEVAREEDHGS